jgi:hypothetical protein
VPEAVIVSVPVTVPKAVAAKVTEIVQDLPAARDGPHVVLETANGLPVFVGVILVMEIAAAVLFVTVTFLAALVLLTAILPKLSVVGVTDWARAGR